MNIEIQEIQFEVVHSWFSEGRKHPMPEVTRAQSDANLRAVVAIGSGIHDDRQQALAEALVATEQQRLAGKLTAPPMRYFTTTFNARLRELPSERAQDEAKLARIAANARAEEKIADFRLQAAQESAAERRAAKKATVG